MATVIERDLLPILNIMVLLIPVVLLGVELTSLGAIQASMPDFSADVAELETPRAPRSPVAAIPAEVPMPQPILPRADEPEPEPEPEPAVEPSHSAPVFPDPMLGYGF